MSRRSRWVIGGAVVVLIAAAVVWLAVSWPRGAAPSTPEPSPSASAAHDVGAAAQTALERHLEECTAAGAPDGVVPAACGIRLPWGAEFADVSDVRFRIDRMPELALSDDGRGFIADGGVLVATVTGTGQDGAVRTATYRTESWGVRGDVDVSGDDVAVIVW